MSLIKNNNENWLPSIFEDLFIQNPLMVGRNYFEKSLPAVNIKETPNDFQVEVAAPGLNKEDFVVELEHQVLTIFSEKSQESKEVSEDERYTRKEFSYNAFKRAFTLPEKVEFDKIEAVYTNGILKVIVPKKEESKEKPKKMIAVS